MHLALTTWSQIIDYHLQMRLFNMNDNSNTCLIKIKRYWAVLKIVENYSDTFKKYLLTQFLHFTSHISHNGCFPRMIYELGAWSWSKNVTLTGRTLINDVHTVSWFSITITYSRSLLSFEVVINFFCNSLLHELLQISYAQHYIRQILISPWTSQFFMNVDYVSLLKYTQPARSIWI